MIKNRIALAAGLAAFLVLANSGAGYALWSSQARTAASVSAGTLSFTQTGFADLAHSYTSAAPTDTAAIRVSNTGSVTAPFAMTLGVQQVNALSSGVVLRTWPTGSACNSSTPVPSTATNSSWTNVPTVSGTLAPASDFYLCVRTSITALQLDTLGGTTMQGTVSVASSIGSWVTFTGGSTVTQTVPDSTPPTAPGAPRQNVSGTNAIAISWTPSADTVGVTSYDIYRGGTLIGSTTGPDASFSDVAVTAGETYSYTVRARDAAGLWSADSAAGSATAPFDPSKWYTIRTSEDVNKACISASRSGDTLQLKRCDTGLDQQWRFVPVEGAYLKVVSRVAPALAWSVEVTSSRREGTAYLREYGGGADQRWLISPVAPGEFRLDSKADGYCLSVEGTEAQRKCDPAQTFTVAAAG